MAVVELFANATAPGTPLATTLGSGYTSGGTSMTVASSTGFPAAATGVSQFHFIVDSEIFVCSNVSGTTWTVAGAQEGTIAANHLSAAPVTYVVTAAGLTQITANLPKLKVVTSADFTTTSTTGAAILTSDLTYPAGTYKIRSRGSYSSSSIGVGAKFRITATGTVTALQYSAAIGTGSTATSNTGNATANVLLGAAVVSAAGNLYNYDIEGVFVTSTSGTFSIEVAASTSGTITCKVGDLLEITPVI